MRLPRNAQLWLPGYVRDRVSRWLTPEPAGRFRVWLAVADHYEPYWRTHDDALARERVASWRKLWPPIARRYSDSRGRPPCYTFFYPQEEYRPWLLDELAAMTQEGLADVEVHIHHNNEGEQNFLDRMESFISVLESRHGLLRRWKGRPAFGFIHGNWALDNSRPDGTLCGLNNEISLLRDLNCYADFTMPSGSSPTQSRTVNCIYWAVDDPERPRSYDYGVKVTPGGGQSGDLLMVPGPFGLRWAGRFPPRLETGEIAHHDPASPYRVRRWLQLAPRLGHDIFIKLYTHGAQEHNSAALLQGGLDRLYETVTAECAGRGWETRFATPWEMRCRIEEIRTGAAGPPVESS